MTNLLQYGLSALGVVIVLGILFEVYRYIKGHPQALTALEAKVKAVEGKAATLVDVQSIHSKLDSLLTKMDATHAAALAPVSVVSVPLASAPAPGANSQTFIVPIAPTPPNPVPQAPVQDQPWPPADAYGPRFSFDNFDGRPGHNLYRNNTPTTHQLTVPLGATGFTFDVAECPGTRKNGKVEVVVLDANGGVMGRWPSSYFMTDAGVTVRGVTGGQTFVANVTWSSEGTDPAQLDNILYASFKNSV